MDNKSTSSSGGIGFLGVLTIVFIIFKLLDKITWSWWWVFSPMWIPIAVIGGIALIAFIIVLIKEFLR